MSEELVPISSLFFDGPGPHVVRAGFPSAPVRGQELRKLLDTSIIQLGAVSGAVRRKTPARPTPAVGIDSLLYRGHAALVRALEVREEIVATGTAQAPDQIEELLDLVALAATE